MDIDEDLMDIDDCAEQLFDKANEHYRLIVDSISKEDFKFIKQKFQLEDEYEDHINDLRERIKPETESKQNIRNFLEKYPEFRNQQYVNIMEFTNRKIQSNVNEIKQSTVKYIEDNQDLHDNPSVITDIPEILDVNIGTQKISLPTFDDPLLVTLYGILFFAFTIKYYQ